MSAEDRMEAAFKEDPTIGRMRLVRRARVSRHLAQKFLKSKRKRKPKARTKKGGIALNKENVFKERPQDQSKRRFYSLEEGKGYPIDELAKDWGVGIDTIKKHARRWDALRYVEVTPGDYVPCVLHPNTAKRFK